VGPPVQAAAFDRVAKAITSNPVAGDLARKFLLAELTELTEELENRILLENYFLPGDLEAQIEAFVADYNHRRYHESIDN
jgi:transposase InsO family protein